MSRPWAVITGGTSGVGALLSEDLIADFDLVLIHHTNHERAESLREKLRPRGRVELISFDLTQTSRLKALAEDITARTVQGLSLVIHSAGIAQSDLLLGIKAEELQVMTALNLLAPMMLTKHLVKASRLNGMPGFQTIMISSIAAVQPMRGVCAYAATKAGLESFTRSFATEIESYGMTIKCIRLGPVNTPIWQRHQGTREFIVPATVCKAFRDLIDKEPNGSVTELGLK